MKALLLADINPHIQMAQVVADNDIELIITLGDFAREDILELGRITTIPKIGIYGNHCSGTYMEDLGIWNMHLMLWEFKGITFGGFEGCVRYKENPQAIMYTQEQANTMMQGFPKVDVFISHCPPRGINDEEERAHQGFDALRTYLDNNNPRLWMHGHTYPTEETIVAQHGSTKIEYVHGYKIITI